jgi:molecular chaperone IbpA
MTDFFDLLYNSHNRSVLPYDLYQEDGTYVLEMAVAGYNEDDIKITLHNSILTIEANPSATITDRIYYVQKIARRSFKTYFTLSKYALVKEAAFKDGMLKIYLTKNIPEEDKPKQIQISK